MRDQQRLSAEESEGLALLYSLQWAVSLNLSRVFLEGDCRVITDYLNGGQNAYWLANKAADLLAKKASSSYIVMDDIWMDSPPSFLYDQLVCDNINVTEAMA
ncbi:hypothetical protein BVC80_9025g19 [Macleaya cordata]|uniref:RNase H type-1 domain-containing protein n=1 Tax=Macleaya cordata TaxID=56857 RepID=A0A200QUZ2_MACCD|nr:hypothetical protein BVC80_9025g19 [Macleaya cordata]